MRSEEPRWRRYLRFWGRDSARDADDELDFHFAAHVADLMQRGMTRSEAESSARGVFGDVTAIRAELHERGAHRDARLARVEHLRLVLADLRIAVRTLARRPAYAAAAVSTLALGVGAATAVFSVLDGVLLQPLPYPDAGRLVVLWERNVPRARARNVVSVPAFETWREQSTSFVALAGLVPDRITFTDRNPERVYGAAVSPEWFEVVGVAPRLGRGFTAADAVQQPQPIVLSDGLFRDRFGGDESVIGRTVVLGERSVRVSGVMPAVFEPPSFGWLEDGQRYWVPFVPDPDNRQWGRFLLVLGRLRAGTTPAGADAEVERMAAGPGVFDERDEWSADAVGLIEEVTGDMRAQGLAVALAVALLLLIAITNVAGVVLVRVRGRADELRMRVALGASRGSLLRQLLAESGAIALCSLPLAVLLTFAGVYGARRLLPPELPRLDEIGVSWPAIALCAVVLVIATIVIGLAPLVMRRDRASVAVSTARVVRGPGMGVLPAVEIALALTLTVTALLATRSVLNARAVDPGFDAGVLVAARLSLTSDDASGDARRLAASRLERLLAAEPSIDAAGLVSFRPMYAGNPATGVLLHGSDMEPVVSDVLVATAAYFPAAGIDVVEGRTFADADPVQVAPPVVINRTLARQLGVANAVGARITVRLNDPFVEGTVVGVVEDVRLSGPLVEPRATVYIRHADWPVNTVDVVARARTSKARAAVAIRSAVRGLDPRLALWDEMDVERTLHSATARERSLAAVLSVFSVVALLLAAAGVYAGAAVRAAARRRELGVRLALGATPLRLGSRVLGETALMALPGVLAGIAIVLAGSALLRRVLFGIAPTDAPTLAAAAVLLIVVSLLASLLPAWRASRTEPGAVLRME
ncbi:MAG TPA: ABC transporter permease [Longimicrobiales bacterium]